MNNFKIDKRIDAILNKFVEIFMFLLWILIGILVMLKNDFHPDFANYWSLMIAIIYYIFEKFKIIHIIVHKIKGKREYKNGEEYHVQLWKILFNNIIPILSLPFAILLIKLFPEVAFNTNGLAFFAIIFAVATNAFATKDS